MEPGVVPESSPNENPVGGTRRESGGKQRIEEILVSNSSLVSGLSEASGARFSWVEVSQESQTLSENLEKSAARARRRGSGGRGPLSQVCRLVAWAMGRALEGP